jgi:pimeloyl-ACP methyl ester carboxylesterase
VVSAATLERRLLVGGTALVTFHLLDLAFAGPQTSAVGVAAIVLLAVALVMAQPHVTRPTRFALGVTVGLLFAISGAVAHVLDVFTSGPRWTDLSGIAAAVGGLMLIGSGVAALAAPRPAPRRDSRAWRALHLAGWIAGAVLIAQFILLPLFAAVTTTHAIRAAVDDDSLPIPHQTVAIGSPTGDLAAWYVPSRNGAAVLLIHGSGGDRSTVADRAELVARRGYGVLAIDLPGHGESDGRANLLGGNAQPAIAAALGWLDRQPGVDPSRVAGFGTSLGGEVLLEAAARGERLAAVISDGAERAADDRELGYESGLAGVVATVQRAAVRAVSGTEEPPGLLDEVGAIAPRPILLIATGGREHEIDVNRAYAAAAGSTASVWELSNADHTGGLDANPAAYEQRISRFLDRALLRS